MEYERFRAKRETERGEAECALQTGGSFIITVTPRHSSTGRSDYYYTSTMFDCSLITSDQVAADLVAVIGECLAEKRRQEELARGTPVTDGHGMEAVVPPTEVVPVMAIYRVTGGEG